MENGKFGQKKLITEVMSEAKGEEGRRNEEQKAGAGKWEKKRKNKRNKKMRTEK